jgi:hypothetical protein
MHSALVNLDLSMVGWTAIRADGWRMVQCAFSDRNLHLGDAIELHVFAPLEANRRVANDIPLGCPLFLPVHAANCVLTLKVLTDTGMPEGAVDGDTAWVRVRLHHGLCRVRVSIVGVSAVNYLSPFTINCHNTEDAVKGNAPGTAGHLTMNSAI